MEKKCIILFTRTPVAGRTKTRLQPFLSGEECRMLQNAFISDIFTELKRMDVDIIIFHTPEGDTKALRKQLKGSTAFHCQEGSSLGEKMHHAIDTTLASGYSSCILIGSDIPLIRKEDIESAFAVLAQKDIVICPTNDGGYCLVGMKEACREIFEMTYGTGTVFAKTVSAVNAVGKSYGIGNTVLDVDDKADFMTLADRLNEGKAPACICTRRMVQMILDRRRESFELAGNC